MKGAVSPLSSHLGIPIEQTYRNVNANGETICYWDSWDLVHCETRNAWPAYCSGHSRAEWRIRSFELPIGFVYIETLFAPFDALTIKLESPIYFYFIYFFLFSLSRFGFSFSHITVQMVILAFGLVRVILNQKKIYVYIHEKKKKKTEKTNTGPT